MNPFAPTICTVSLGFLVDFALALPLPLGFGSSGFLVPLAGWLLDAGFARFPFPELFAPFPEPFAPFPRPRPRPFPEAAASGVAADLAFARLNEACLSCGI